MPNVGGVVLGCIEAESNLCKKNRFAEFFQVYKICALLEKFAMSCKLKLCRILYCFAKGGAAHLGLAGFRGALDRAPAALLLEELVKPAETQPCASRAARHQLWSSLCRQLVTIQLGNPSGYKPSVQKK